MTLSWKDKLLLNRYYFRLASSSSTYLTGGVTLLIRHAERRPFTEKSDLIIADLTDSGFRQAERFGKNLSRLIRLGEVNSSPIQRCINTAQSILLGSGHQTKITLKWWLFSPFLKTPNESSDGRAFIEVFSDEFGGFNSRYDKRILQMVLQRLRFPSDPETVNLYITHDTTIMPLLAYLLGIDQVNYAERPDFLEGIVLKKVAGQVVLADF